MIDPTPLSPAEILRWYIAAGIDDSIGEQPVDRYQTAKASAKPAGVMVTPEQTVSPAVSAASLDALRALMETYDGCGLKRTSQSTVFGDGDPKARLMIIGEAPGADEDRLGLPFVGASGRLLEAMLAAIGLTRAEVYITNVVPWRPPGNRKPEPAEIALCLPFIRRQIALIAPRQLILLGGSPTAALLERTDPISRLRGQWIDYHAPDLPQPIPAMPTFHPAYLLRTPAHKEAAWRDLLAVQSRLQAP